jgi:hypothetical protein
MQSSLETSESLDGMSEEVQEEREGGFQQNNQRGCPGNLDANVSGT